MYKTSSNLETPPPTRDEPSNVEGVAIKDLITNGYEQTASIPIWKVVLAAIIGIGLGIALTNGKVGPTTAKWVALPGDLFIAALNCLIVPMVFCSVVACIGDLLEAGKATSIGGRTVVFFALCSVTASSTGVLVGSFFASSFQAEIKPVAGKASPRLSLQCPSGGFASMASLASGLISCLSTNGTDSLSLFYVNDTTSYFTLSSSSTSSGYAKLTVSDQVFSILESLVPSNIINAFATASTLSVITFAVAFGIAAARSVKCADDGENYPLLLISHANVICRMLVTKVVTVIPFAVVSMIAGSMAQYSDTTRLLESVGMLLAALVTGLVFHCIGLLGLALYVTTRRNVFSYLRNVLPAQVFIFGCSSSIATLPVTLRCVESTREVTPSLARFVLPLGATSNLNGTAIYMPLACIFMARVSGHEDLLTPVTYVLLAFVGSIASFGVAPVPHSGLVMVITIWRTVFDQDLPAHAFSILVATDWLLNRLRCIVNISNDTIVCRIIAHQCNETAEAQRLVQ